MGIDEIVLYAVGRMQKYHSADRRYPVAPGFFSEVRRYMMA